MGYDQKDRTAGSPQGTIFPVRHWLLIETSTKGKGTFWNPKKMLSFFLWTRRLKEIPFKRTSFWSGFVYRLTSYTCIHCVCSRCPDVNRRRKKNWTWDTHRILIPLSFIQVLIPLSFENKGFPIVLKCTTCWNHPPEKATWQKLIHRPWGHAARDKERFHGPKTTQFFGVPADSVFSGGV